MKVYDDRNIITLGSDKSNNRGRYKVFLAPDRPGAFIAYAQKRKMIKDNGDTIVCERGGSDRIKPELP